MRLFVARLALAGTLCWLGGCAHSPRLLDASLPEGSTARDVELADTPFHPQEAHQCGPAALATVLNAAGVEVTPAKLVDEVFLPARKGSLQIEMQAAVRRHGRLPYPLDADLAALLGEIRAGRPVLVLQNLGLRALPVWHYAVVIGYHADRDELVLRSGVTRRKLMRADRFLRSWDPAGRWAMVILAPGEMPTRPLPAPYLHAAAALESAGHPEAAARAFRAAADTWPGESTVWLGLANNLHALGRTEAAVQAYDELLARFPDHVIGHNNLAQVLSDLGCGRRARAVIERAMELVPPDSPLVEALRDTRAGISSSDDTRCRLPPRE